MAWKLTDSPKVVTLSKGLLNEFTTMATLPRDRPITERRLVAYRKIRDKGEFRSVTWASAHCLENNTIYRINGKHTGIVFGEVDPLPKVNIIVERYTCDTLKDVANLYNTFDSKIAGRSIQDINLSYASTIIQLNDVPKLGIGLSVSALAFKEYGPTELYKSTPEERAQLLDHGWPFAVWLHEVLQTMGSKSAQTVTGNLSRIMARQPIVNAMCMTWTLMPVKAKEFWEEVRDETNPNTESPSRILARYLSRVILGGGYTRSSKDRKMVDWREMYSKCIHAWNAWRKGTTTNLHYYPDKDMPEPVK